ncbi:hypothetical protein BDQ17DRAFT_1437542 [Cyathus striatus]|nr:hypothetical protein BDQ17DRAFT_1437542 [Cyathus striatus]
MTEYEQDIWAERKGRIRMKGALDMKRVMVEKTVEQGLRTIKATGNTNRARMAKSQAKKKDDGPAEDEEECECLIVTVRDITSRPPGTALPGLPYLCQKHYVLLPPHSATKVLEDVSLMIHPGGRAGLVGKNWDDKPTLVGLLTGVGELVPKKGSIERHTRPPLGHFDQHCVGTEERRGLRWRGLSGFGFHRRTAVSPIVILSGGQKVRLALAIVVHPAPNLTTHLDKDTIVVLIQALRKYTGAVLLVSHDRHFVRCAIEDEHAVPRLGDSDGESDKGSDEDDDTGQSGKGTVYAVGPKGRVKPLSGGMDDYAVVIERQMRKLGLS